MNSCEYYRAKKLLKPQKAIVRGINQNHLLYIKELEKFIEMVIAVKAHAWCMDVKNERKKISKLIVESLVEVQKIAVK